jgi:uncharacterized protein YndB with AHSA1/START domain
MTNAKTEPAGPRARIVMERTFDASIAEVWALWTTKDGFEAWWGPEGFGVDVHAIDLRPGGEMRYAMKAVAPEQVAAMRQMGMPLVTEVRLTYTEIVPHRRLAYVHRADFIPGVAPYDVATSVELHEGPGGVRMVITSDAMHDAHWTDMARRGWESQLGKAPRALEAIRRRA